MGSTLRAASLNPSAQPRPAPFPLPFAVLFRLWRQSPPLPLLGPRSHPLGFLRLPLNPLVPSRAERHSIAPLHKATGQLVKPGLVLASAAGRPRPYAGARQRPAPPPPVQTAADRGGGRLGARSSILGGTAGKPAFPARKSARERAPRNFLGSLPKSAVEQVATSSHCPDLAQSGHSGPSSEWLLSESCLRRQTTPLWSQAAISNEILL